MKYSSLLSKSYFNCYIRLGVSHVNMVYKTGLVGSVAEDGSANKRGSLVVIGSQPVRGGCFINQGALGCKDISHDVYK